MTEEDQPRPARGPVAYERAAKEDDPARFAIGLLKATVRELAAAKKAQAWTATTVLHKLACEQATQVRSARVAQLEQATDEALASEGAELIAGLPEAVRLRLVGG